MPVRLSRRIGSPGTRQVVAAAAGGKIVVMPSYSVLLPIDDEDERAEAMIEAAELQEDLRRYADNVTVAAEITADGEVLTFSWPEVEVPVVDRRQRR